MRCPKCEIGSISRVVFKQNNESASLCEYCGTVWLENEDISISGGHDITTHSLDDKTYTILEEEPDEESRSVLFSKYQ